MALDPASKQRPGGLGGGLAFHPRFGGLLHRYQVIGKATLLKPDGLIKAAVKPSVMFVRM
jgi:hypothetical protein